MKYRKLIVGLFIVLIAFPGSALAFYKPTRVIVPQFFGVECFNENICIDDKARLAEAETLRAEAITFVIKNIGAISKVPRFIFCCREECARKFGLYGAAAYNVGTYGIVIRTKGWEPHFVRHELIHHLQNERLGSIKASFLMPKWFVEGMAYALSDDPRRPIPVQELEQWRSQFEAWNTQGVTAETHKTIWQRAKQL